MEIIKRITRPFRRWSAVRKAKKEYAAAVKKANMLHTIHRERFYVLIDGEKLRVINRFQFRKLKGRRSFATVHRLLEGAVYFTPDRGGNGAIDELDRKARQTYFIKAVYNNY
jgi:hypothetical protein